MNKTHQPQVTHMAILHAIRRQLLTLVTEVLIKNYWITGPSLYCPCRITRGLTKGLRQLYWRHRCSWRLRQRKLLLKRRQAAGGHSGILGELVGLTSTEAPLATFVMLLKYSNRPPHLWLGLLELTYPVASTWARRLTINVNPLPQDWSDNPKKWTLSLTESWPIIAIRRLF